MSVYHKKQEKCSHSTINKKGFCIHSYWHGQACYCKGTRGGKITSLLYCPYAYRTQEDSNVIPGYEWTKDL